MYQIQVSVRGIGRGLLMHKFSVEATTEMESEIRKKSVKLTPEEAAERVAYRLTPEDGQGRGQLYIPAEHFLGALVNAGSSLQVKGKGKATYKKVFKGVLEIDPDQIGITDSEGNPLFDFSIDSRAVVIKATKGRIIRHRPLIREWQANFNLIVEDDSVHAEVVQSALEEAGGSHGIGDYRPRFGHFQIAQFKTI